MDPSDIWSGWPIQKIPELSDHGFGADHRKYERAKKTHKEQIKALEIIGKSVPGLVKGKEGLYLTEDNVRVLLKEIHKDCNGYVIRQRHNFLAKGLMEGRKKLDWRTPIPSPMIVLPREPSPFTTAKFEILESLRFLEKKLFNTLADSSFYHEESDYILRAQKAKLKDISSSQLITGQFLFSAIINGALLHKVWVNALLNGLHEYIISDKSSLWLNLTHTTGEGKFAVTLRRRWFPDHLTSSLLVRMINNDILPTLLTDEEQLHNPIFYLTRFYASIGVSQKSRPTLNQLISAAKTKLALRIPPYLIAYAGSLNQSQSLSDTGWLRLTDNVVPMEPPEDIPPTNDNALLKNSDNPLVLPHHNKLPDQLQQLRQLHSCFTEYHYKTAPKVGVITKRIEQFIVKGNLCGMLELLSQWSLEMMRNKRITGKKSKPKSMNTYLYAIAKHLVVYGTTLNPEKLSADDWSALFDKVREASPSPQRLHYKSKRLRAFNDFLVSTYNYPLVHVELASSDIRNIRASIISSNEYKVIKQTIQHNVLQPQRIRNINSLLTTLGFRCGLRRNEALKIEMSDVQIERQHGKQLILSIREEIFIRNNRYGTVKSYKSTRRLPLHILLTKNEIEELNNWVNQRKQELGNKKKAGALLFCHLQQDSTLLPTRETINQIQEVMRHVTKDPTLTYHSLRHSFINILLLSIIQDDLPETLLETWSDIADGKQGFAPIKAIRNAILLSTNIEPSRRYLYAVSQFCGHVDPKETLLTYLHVLDWILGAFLKKSSPILPKKVQANLLGISLNSLKVIKSKAGIKGDVTAQDIWGLLVKRTKNLPLPNYENMVPLADIPSEKLLKAERHENIAMLLYQIFEDISTGSTAEDIAEQYRVSPDELLTWEAIAKKIVSLTTPSGAESSRLLTKPRTQAKSPKKINRSLFYPKKPHSLLDQEDATTICNNVIDLYERDNTLMVNALQLYFLREDSSLPDISFASEEEAKIFVSFLHDIQIAKERIMITLYLRNPADEKDQQSEFWSQLLDLETTNFTILKGTYKMRKYPHGKITLWVTNLPKEKWVRHAKGLKNNQRRKFHTASGLRFALFMAAVYLGVLP